MKVTIYGCSDDLVEVEGDLAEEFNGDDVTLVFGDGTHIHAQYQRDGCWRIDRIKEGTARYAKTFVAVDSDSDDYSDRVELEGALGSVDKIRSHLELIHALEDATWRDISKEDAPAIYALAKKAGVL